VPAHIPRVQVITKQMLMSRASTGSEVCWKKRRLVEAIAIVNAASASEIAAVLPIGNAADVAAPVSG
jgi:hypothetical protein